MAAPTFIQEAETTWTSSGSAKTTSSFSVQASDVLVAFGITADNSVSLGISGGGLTWTPQQLINIASNTWVGLWTAIPGTSTSITTTFTPTGTIFFGGNVLTFRGSNGVGTSAQTNNVNAPQLSITPTQSNSALVVAIGDWGAANGTTRTWRTVNSITPVAGTGEVTYFRDAGGAQYTVYGGYYSDVGISGAAKIVGITTPSAGVTYAIASVEVLGSTGGVTNAKTGSGVIVRIGSGVDALAPVGANTYTKTGGGAGGSGTPTYGLLSLSHPGGLIARGFKNLSRENTGLAVSVKTASAANTVTYSETGVGVSVKTASGSKAITFNKTGAAITVLTGSSPRSITANKTGRAVVDWQGTGARSSGQLSKSGLAAVPFVGIGKRSNTFTKAGSATYTWDGSGTRTTVFIYTKTGAGISVRDASGNRAVTYSKVGTGLMPMIGQGAKVTGSFFNKTGKGDIGFASSTAKIKTSFKIGLGTISYSASAVTELQDLSGTTYFKTGQGVAVMAPSGRATVAYIRQGIAEAPRVGRGSLVHLIPSSTEHMGTASMSYGANGSDLHELGVTVIVTTPVPTATPRYTAEEVGNTWALVIDDEMLEVAT